MAEPIKRKGRDKAIADANEEERLNPGSDPHRVRGRSRRANRGRTRQRYREAKMRICEALSPSAVRAE